MCQPLLFKISYYGRLGYLLLSLIPLFSSLFLIVPYSEFESLPWWMLVLFPLVVFVNLSLFSYAVSQVLRTSPRFIASKNSLKFNGLLKSKEINWQNIINYESGHSFRFGLSSIRIEFIDEANNKRKKLVVDTNGIYPDNSELCSTIGYYISRFRSKRI